MSGNNLSQITRQTTPVTTPPVSPVATPSQVSDKSMLLLVNPESLDRYADSTPNNVHELKEMTPPSKGRDSSSSFKEDQSQSCQQEDVKVKDLVYSERRRKNNLASKMSRDRKKAKESKIAIRAEFLEQENLQLRFKVARLEGHSGILFDPMIPKK